MFIQKQQCLKLRLGWYRSILIYHVKGREAVECVECLYLGAFRLSKELRSVTDRKLGTHWSCQFN